MSMIDLVQKLANIGDEVKAESLEDANTWMNATWTATIIIITIIIIIVTSRNDTVIALIYLLKYWPYNAASGATMMQTMRSSSSLVVITWIRRSGRKGRKEHSKY